MRCGSIRAARRDARHGARAAARDHDGWTVTFGEYVFVYAANDRFDDVAASVERSGGQLHEPDPDRRVRKAHLHLVTQVGTSFTTAHPDVPVLFDGGRWLVVEVAPDAAAELGGHDHRIERLTPNSTVVGSPTVGRQPWADQHVDLADAVDASRLQVDIGHLVAFDSRHSGSRGFRRAVTWAADRLGDLGLDVEQHAVPMPGGVETANVVARLSGDGADGGLVVVAAHLDSVNGDEGPDAPAPGADDNASGAAAILELARVMAGQRTHHDVAFVLYGGEEQGLFGSRAHVASLSDAERAAVVAVVNMDMIASLNTPDPTVLIEAPTSADALADVLAGAAATVTDLVVQRSTNPWGSDHVPWLDAGVPAALTIEGADRGNGLVHTADDLPAPLRIHLAGAIARMNVVAVAHLAGRRVDAAPDPDTGPMAPADPDRGQSGATAGETPHDRDVAVLGHHVDVLLATYARLAASGHAAPQLLAQWQAILQIRAGLSA